MDALTVLEQIMLEAASKDVGEPLEDAIIEVDSNGEKNARWGNFGYCLEYDEDWLAEKGYL